MGGRLHPSARHAGQEGEHAFPLARQTPQGRKAARVTATDEALPRGRLPAPLFPGVAGRPERSPSRHGGQGALHAPRGALRGLEGPVGRDASRAAVAFTQPSPGGAALPARAGAAAPASAPAAEEHRPAGMRRALAEREGGRGGSLRTCRETRRQAPSGWGGVGCVSLASRPPEQPSLSPPAHTLRPGPMGGGGQGASRGSRPGCLISRRGSRVTLSGRRRPDSAPPSPPGSFAWR